MRKMKIAMMVCVTVVAIMLFGQSVWAGAEVTEFTWYWCGPNQKVADGTVWYTGNVAGGAFDGVKHSRGGQFYAPLCKVEACTCAAIRAKTYTPDGYLFMFHNSDWKRPEGSTDGWGHQWGNFLISSGISGSGTTAVAVDPLWEGTFTGFGDGLNYRFQKLVGSGLEEYAGMQLKALCETIDRTKTPNVNDHTIEGYILNSPATE